MKKIIIFVFLTVSSSLFADFSYNTIINDLERFEEMTGLKEISLVNYNSENNLDYKSGYTYSLEISKNLVSSSIFDLNFILPQMFLSYNTAYGYGFNDRVAIQGRGFNTSFITGFSLINPYITVVFQPEVFLSENLHYDIVETSSSSGYGDYWAIFDNLQRYGEDPFYLLSLGQSSLSVNAFNAKINLATENIITAFNKKNSFLLSSNANGFPHLDLGTNEKVNIKYLGDIDAKMMWGILTESKFFDNDDSNDHGWISGTFIGFSPFFQKNLMLGFNHLYTTPLSSWDRMDLIRGIPGIDRTNSATDLKDMMISMAFRWVFPKSNMEIYGEWARNDNFKALFDIMAYPEHTQGYTLGFSTILAKPFNNSQLQFSTEYSNSMQQRTRELRAAGPWYRHGWSGWTQGYTNEGEVLGLGIGPGSESLWCEFKLLLKNSGFIALTGERIVIDKDYSYYLRAEYDGDPIYDDYYNVPFYMNMGLSTLYPVGNFNIYANFLNNIGYDKNFIESNVVYNIHFELGVSYNL